MSAQNHYELHHPIYGTIRCPRSIVESSTPRYVLPDGTCRSIQQMRNLEWALRTRPGGTIKPASQ